MILHIHLHKTPYMFQDVHVCYMLLDATAILANNSMMFIYHCLFRTPAGAARAAGSAEGALCAQQPSSHALPAKISSACRCAAGVQEGNRAISRCQEAGMNAAHAQQRRERCRYE